MIYRTILRLTLMAALMAVPARAQNISVDFTATIEETTCTMELTALSSGTAAQTGEAQYTLTIPAMTILQISQRLAASEASFKLLPTACNNAISGVDMTITGATTASSVYLLENALSATGAAQNVGLGFKPMGNADNIGAIKVDGSGTIRWTKDQIQNGMDLTAMIRRASTSDIVAGDFQAKATFTFIYR
ncbi:fimbrial protein [Pseudocitrobacter cyperus]|uniref:Fimbrial protein n=1 Tax=Pseudocitrobacter cyperus TaxID=3112843 RepID=A0ABV0HHN1_9ENTR